MCQSNPITWVSVGLNKPTDIHWYTIARHTEILTALIVDLDLQHITLVCQDWGGPTGLAQAAMMPERFDHLVILNTWLHHPEYEYSEGITTWNAGWQKFQGAIDVSAGGDSSASGSYSN